jgi:hypothetical protein
MNPYAAELIDRYRRLGVLMDSNLLVLYVVGSFNPDLIQNFKRTQQFASDDFTTLAELVKQFRTVATTPHILTEVSNLLGQLPDHLRFACFGEFASKITLLDEEHPASADIAKIQEFIRFGLTDAAIFFLARGKYMVLTDNFRLSQYLASAGIDVLNFNHLRPI